MRVKMAMLTPLYRVFDNFYDVIIYECICILQFYFGNYRERRSDSSGSSL